MSIIPNLDEQVPVKVSSKSFDPLLPQCPPTDNVGVAKYAIIGDAPNSIEVNEQAPFEGPAGKQLNRVLAAVNIPKYECYLTLACKAVLPNNNVNKLWTAKGWRHPAWEQLRENLIQELEAFSGNMIILMGTTPMLLLLDDPKITSVEKYQGTIFSTDALLLLQDRIPGKFVLITYNPKSALPYGKPFNFYKIIANITKLSRLYEEPELLCAEPKIKICPGFYEAINYLEAAKLVETIGFDIEATPKIVTCFSVAISETEAMSIPLIDNTGNYWTPEQETEIWLKLAELLGRKKPALVCQNGMFDLMFLLRTMGIKSENFSFDTMLAQHICYTDLPKGLDYLTAAYTYYPYYKDDGKQSHFKLIKDWPAYWTYNGKDSAYLLTIKKGLEEELDMLGEGAWEAMRYSMNLHKPLMEMEFNGILTDQKGIQARKKILNNVINKLQKAIDKIVGYPLNIGSSKQMINYFYVEMNLKPYLSKDKRPTCDAVALSRIAKKKKPKAAVTIAKITLKLRKLKKLVSTYFDVKVDEDNHLRCTHKISGTSSGRIATAKTFFGTGANLQNQSPIFKKYLIAKKDHLIAELDLQKAEAHVVAYLAQDANMIKAFTSGVDVHSFNASKIFNVPIEEVTKKQRSLGKRVVHASNYSMGPGTFSNTLAKDDVFMSMSECKQLLQAYQSRFPGLKHWKKGIDQEIYNSRILYNLYGRPKRFLGMLNDALLRNAYSYKPQSTVAELLNRGAIKISNDPRLGKDGYDIDLLTTVHDSVIPQFRFDQLDNLHVILQIIQEHMTHEFTHKGKSFTIGLDAKIGFSWGSGMVELAGFDKASVEQGLEKLGF